MGLITQLKEMIIRRKEEQKSQPEQEIEEYIESEKMKHRIAFIKQWEHDKFLNVNGAWNQND